MIDPTAIWKMKGKNMFKAGCIIFLIFAIFSINSGVDNFSRRKVKKGCCAFIVFFGVCVLFFSILNKANFVPDYEIKSLGSAQEWCEDQSVKVESADMTKDLIHSLPIYIIWGVFVFIDTVVLMYSYHNSSVTKNEVCLYFSSLGCFVFSMLIMGINYSALTAWK